MTTDTVRTDATAVSAETALLARARRRVALKRGFLMHAMVFAVVNLGLLVLSAATGGDRGLHAPLWGWGFGLMIHGIVVAMKLQGEGFHDRQVAAEVERLRRRG